MCAQDDGSVLSCALESPKQLSQCALIHPDWDEVGGQEAGRQAAEEDGLCFVSLSLKGPPPNCHFDVGVWASALR